MNKINNHFSRTLIIATICILFGIIHFVFGCEKVFADGGKCFYFVMNVTTQHNTEKTTTTVETQKVCSATGETKDIELKGSGSSPYVNITKNGNQLSMSMVNSGGALVKTNDIVKTYDLNNYSFNKLSTQMNNDFWAQFKSGVTYGTAGTRSWDGTTVKAASWMKTEAYDETTSEDKAKEGSVDKKDEASEDDESDQGDPCYNADVDSMSWVLCPALNNMNYTASKLSGIIDGWLTVDTELYNDSSSTYTVWQVMRDIANITIVIILLIVIFSQLTGYGIDNYGIKKILPKLIAMAVLINLSFILCEIAIDLSNVFGNGLKNLFGSIGELVLTEKESEYALGERFIGDVITSIFAAAGVAGVTAAPAISVATVVSGGGPMAVIVIVLALLAIIAAILIFFITLGARMIIIIMCTAVSPIAFACYILPNTQKFFKKWWDIFKVALVIFPICGALWGISYLIKAMVLTMEGIHLWMLVVALIAPFLSFFLLPSLLKGAISALGSIGGALSAMGNSFKGGLRSGRQTLENTESYKEQQKEGARRMQQRRAQRTVDRLDKKRGKGALNSFGERRLARSSQILDSLKREDNAARTILAERDFRNSTEPELQSEWEKAFDDGNEERLDAITNVMSSRWGTGAANWMAKTLSKKDVANNQNMQRSIRTLQDNMEHNTTFASNMKNKASDAYAMISNAGMVHNDTTHTNDYVNMSHFSANNPIAKDVKDWSTQSADTLKRAIDSGALTDDNVKRLLSSNDPDIQSGILSDSGKLEVLQAQAQVAHLNEGKEESEKIKLTEDKIKDYANDYNARQQAQKEKEDQRQQSYHENIQRIADGVEELKIDHSTGQSHNNSGNGTSSTSSGSSGTFTYKT